MIYENLIQENKAAFLAKLTEISAKLKVVPDWLMVVFKVESSINHRAINQVSGATGLIQFMPATATGLGTSTFALRNMSNVQQLDYVYAYFKPYAGRINSITDLYTITFFPVALGKTDDFVLKTAKTSAGTIAAQNAAYDINKDKQITYKELKDSINSRVPSEAMIFLKKK